MICNQVLGFTFWGKKKKKRKTCLDLAYLFKPWACHLVTPASAMWVHSEYIILPFGVPIFTETKPLTEASRQLCCHAEPRAIPRSHKSDRSQAKGRKAGWCCGTLRNTRKLKEFRRVSFSDCYCCYLSTQHFILNIHPGLWSSNWYWSQRM